MIHEQRMKPIDLNEPGGIRRRLEIVQRRQHQQDRDDGCEGRKNRYR